MDSDFEESDDEEYTGYIPEKVITKGLWREGKKFTNANQKKVNCTLESKANTSNAAATKIPVAVQRTITQLMYVRKEESICSRLTPNSLLVSLTAKEEPILKGIEPLGYYRVDRCKGLTFDEAKLALSKIAKVHADYITYNYRLNSASLEEDANFYDVPEISKQIANAAILAAKTNFPNFEKISKKVEHCVHRFDARLYNTINGNTVRLLNYGDASLNNFIFKHKNGILKDAILLESQAPLYGSYALDLNFFLHTSLEVEVLKNQREELICSYHESLQDILSKRQWLKAAPSIDDILKEVRDSEFYSFYTVMCELPLICLERDQCDTLVLENFSDKNFLKKISYNFFKCSRVLETLQHTLWRLDKLGKLG